MVPDLQPPVCLPAEVPAAFSDCLSEAPLSHVCSTPQPILTTLIAHILPTPRSFSFIWEEKKESFQSTLLKNLQKGKIIRMWRRGTMSKETRAGTTDKERVEYLLNTFIWILYKWNLNSIVYTEVFPHFGFIPKGVLLILTVDSSYCALFSWKIN